MINIGVLGLGYISERVAQGIYEANNAHLYAVSSSNEEKIDMMRKRYDIDVAYHSLDAMVNDDKLDLVYIATPNKLHYEHIMKCLKQNKHVICEKPMVATMSELSELFAFAKKQKCFLMEAEKTIFTPLNQKIKRMIGEGVIGDVVSIEASYCTDTYKETDANEHWVFDADFGGSMFDIGVYPVCYANFFANSYADEINMKSTYAKKGYDIENRGTILYQNGVIANIGAGWICEPNAMGIITGTRGYIITENFWKTNVAILMKGHDEEVIEVESSSDFKGEIEHVANCIEKSLLESPILGYAQSAEILHIVLNTIERDGNE